MLTTNPELVFKVILQNGRKDKRINDLVKTLSFQKISFTYADRLTLDKISKGEVHQGVVSEVAIPPILNQESLIKSIIDFDQNPRVLIKVNY